MHICFFIYQTSSFLISYRLWKYWLHLYFLVIISFFSSFLQVAMSGVILVTQANILRLGLRLVQADLYSEKSHCSFASQYLGSQHLYRLKLADWYVGSTPKTYYQGFSETPRNCKRLYCTCIVRGTLEQCWQSSCCFFKIRSKYTNLGSTIPVKDQLS